MRRTVALVLFAMLAGCVEWPDVEAPRPSRAVVGWPELVPISSVPTPGGAAREATANEVLLARAAALRARAAILRRPVPDQAAFERLRARLAR